MTTVERIEVALTPDEKREVLITSAVDSMNRSLYQITDGSLVHDQNAQQIIRSWLYAVYQSGKDAGYEAGALEAVRAMRVGGAR